MTGNRFGQNHNSNGFSQPANQEMDMSFLDDLDDEDESPTLPIITANGQMSVHGCACEGHQHVWPTSGTLTIERCEHYCAFCVGEKADKHWMSAWHIRRHVREFHGKRGFDNLVVEVGWKNKPEGNLKPENKKKPAPGSNRKRAGTKKDAQAQAAQQTQSPGAQTPRTQTARTQTPRTQTPRGQQSRRGQQASRAQQSARRSQSQQAVASQASVQQQATQQQVSQQPLPQQPLYQQPVVQQSAASSQAIAASSPNSSTNDPLRDEVIMAFAKQFNVPLVTACTMLDAVRKTIQANNTASPLSSGGNNNGYTSSMVSTNSTAATSVLNSDMNTMSPSSGSSPNDIAMSGTGVSADYSTSDASANHTSQDNITATDVTNYIDSESESASGG